jgi:HSP20 family protein
MTHLRTTCNRDAFDVLFKNFFNHEALFTPVIDTKIGHPVDIFEDKKGLYFEIAGTGLSKEDINISIEGDVLRVSYDKKDEDLEERKYYHRGISKKSFNLGYRIPLTKYDISKAKALMKDGLLSIDIPIAEEAKPKTLKIN